MCGIVVVIGKNSKEKAKKALNKLVHRGGDSFNIITIDNISFGFTRLAINDQRKKGNQPFEFGDYIGLFNAEIYNHKELTKKYKLAHNNKSDCAVILPLYQKFKEDIIDYLDGFFSGVIYNKKNKQIMVIKDYLGKKPLFFAYDSNTQYIISELKILPQIQYFEIIPKAFSKIENLKVSIVKQYSKSIINKEKSQLKNYLFQAVKKRIIGIENMKFGVFLSGGLDSSIVATLINQMITKKIILPTQVHYYCIVDSKSSDFKYLNIIKNFLKIKDNSISYIPLPNNERLLELLKKVVYSTESTNPSIISNGIGAYLLSKKAKEDGIKVVVTGDGADEVFLGYYHRKDINSKTNWKQIQQEFINELYLTELRRIDLACMANSIEIRCPFLDKKVYEIALGLEYEDLFGQNNNSLNKNILREIFKNELPKKIVNRKKVSFDVGSGLQKKVIKLCTKANQTEREYLQNIWNIFFAKELSSFYKNTYFYSYPKFDTVIDTRGKKYQYEI